MCWMSLCLFLSGVAGSGRAESPLVEQFLHSGRLARGEQVLTTALANDPKNDEVRFGLGVLQVFRGVERLGQALYEHGVKSEHNDLPFLRLPVPANPDPTPISYAVFRRILDDFRHDLLVAEATLAGVTDDQVKLPLRLADIRLDLDGDGQATDKLSDILQKLVRQPLPFLKANPGFLICFDRGDVAWLRAYCHLLSAMIDIYLAFDMQPSFDGRAPELFAKPKKTGQPAFIWWDPLIVKEPLRLGRFRRHILQVCVLNRETWRFIRAERDNDHEWLPNPRQTGVLGLPVRDDMIDSWLEMVGELEALFNGTKLVPYTGHGDRLLNLKALLEDPPDKINIWELSSGGPGGKYLSHGKPIELNALWRLSQVFGDTLSVAYAVWFN